MGFIKKLITSSVLLAGSAVVASSIYARKYEENNKQATEEFDSKKEAVQALGFNFKEPTKMLENLQRKSYRVFNDKTVCEVRYEEEDGLGVTLRVSNVLRPEELNNDPNLYNEVESVEIDGVEVSLLGEEGAVEDILFIKDDISYALISEVAMSSEAAQEIVKSI